MINNTTDSKENESKLEETTPDDAPGIYVRGFVRIVDPESGKVLLETNN